MPTFPFTVTDGGHTYTYSFVGDDDKVDRSTTRQQELDFTLLTTNTTMGSYGASIRFSDDTLIFLGTVHPECTFTYVNDISAKVDPKSVPSKRVFNITVSYSNNPDTSVSGGSFAATGPGAPAIAAQEQGVPPEQRVLDPIARTATPMLVVKSRCTTRKIAVYADRNGKAFKNTIGDPLFPPMERDVPTVTYTFSINRLLPYEAHYDYVGMVNSWALAFPNRIRTWGVETLKLMDLDIEPMFQNGVAYWVHNYTIESGPYWNYGFTEYLGWVREFPNVGKRKRIGAVLDPINAGVVLKTAPIIEHGAVVMEPKYLTQEGDVLPDGFTDDQIVWIRRNPDPLFRMEGLWA